MANKSQTTVLLSDASGTFGAGAVTALAADPGRGTLIISNPGNATLYVSFSGTAVASTGHPVASGGILQFSGGALPGNAVSMIGTNGQPYTVSYA